MRQTHTHTVPLHSGSLPAHGGYSAPRASSYSLLALFAFHSNNMDVTYNSKHLEKDFPLMETSTVFSEQVKFTFCCNTHMSFSLVF